jgi:hypothetical protein
MNIKIAKPTYIGFSPLPPQYGNGIPLSLYPQVISKRGIRGFALQ